MGISYQKKRQTPKRKAGGSNPPEDTISKNAKVIFLCERWPSHFSF